MPFKDSTSSISTSSNVKEIVNLNISIVGLSGPESIKGIEGVGKSCLCSRFVSNKEDDYRKDHISNLSLSDWHSSVVNRNHWLYWGSTIKKYDDNLDICFNLIEQTEFINDESMIVFDERDLQSYSKRCSMLKLTSPLKTVYRRKEQFASHEYNYGKFPTDCLNIDGFICLCDPTQVSRRDFNVQLNELNQILTSLIKTKRPIVLVTTKHDKKTHFKQEYLNEIERLLNKKEFLKTQLHPYLIEISSHLNINVNTPFNILAQLCNKHISKLSTSKILIIKYNEGYEVYFKRFEQYKVYLTSLLQEYVQTYKFKYEQLYSLKKKELDSLIDFFGFDFIQTHFTTHLNNLKLKFIQAQTKKYLARLETLLNNVFYKNDLDKNFYLNNTWSKVMDSMKKNKEFNKYIIETNDETLISNMYSLTSKTTNKLASKSWFENEIFEENQLSIPYELFISNDCREKFDSIVKTMKTNIEKNESKELLMNLLKANAEKGLIQPGKSYEDAQILLMGRLFYESLSENERLNVYNEFQKNLFKKSTQDYKELLLENCDLFVDIILKQSVENCDVEGILEKLKHDQRHQFLDKLKDKRTNLVLKHIAFLSGISREQCDCGILCLDLIISEYLKLKYNDKLNESKLLKPLSFFRLNKYLNIIIYGTKELSEYLLNELRSLCYKNNEYHYSNQAYNINFEVINSEEPLDNLNLNFFIHGIFYITTKSDCIETFEKNLNSLLTLNNIKNNQITVFNFTNRLNTIELNPLEYANLSTKNDILNYCKENNLNYIDSSDDNKILMNLKLTLEDYLNKLNSNDLILNSIDELSNKRNSLSGNDDYAEYVLHLTTSPSLIPTKDSISLNLLCCIMCQNDQNLLDLILRPFLNQNFFYNPLLTINKNTILIEIYNGYQKQLISIEFVSYHLAIQYLSSKRIFNYDGHIFCYSVDRPASFVYAKCLAKQMDKNDNQDSNKSDLLTPISKPFTSRCLIAITKKSSAELFNDNLSEKLLQNGNYLADELNLKLLIATSEFSNQTFAYSSFIESCLKAKKLNKNTKKSTVLNEIHINLDALKLANNELSALNSRKPSPLPFTNEIIITSPSLNDNSLIYDESDQVSIVNTTNKIRSLSTDVYLSSPKIKSSSSSSNISFNYDTSIPSSNQQNPQQSQNKSKMSINNSKNKLNIFSLDSCGASTSSLSSSNRLNSTPSPSYLQSNQKDRSPACCNSPQIYIKTSLSQDISPSKNFIKESTANGCSLEVDKLMVDKTPQPPSTPKTNPAPLAKAESVEINESAKKQTTFFLPTIVHENDEKILNLDKLEKAQKEANTSNVKPSSTTRTNTQHQSAEAEDLTKQSKKQSKSKIRKKELNKSFDDMPSQTVSCIDYSSLQARNDDYDEDSHHISIKSTKSSKNFINKVSEKFGVKSKQSKKSSSNLNGCSNNMQNTHNSDIQFLSLDLSDSNRLTAMNSSTHSNTSNRNKATTPVGMFSSSSNGSSSASGNERCIENDCLSNTTGIPFIVEKCLEYIEDFGMDSEGIYRVSGHKQYTDSLFDDLINRQETIDLKSYSPTQINVNIVATVIKDYFRHLKEPIIGNNLQEFIDLSKIYFNPTISSLNLSPTDRKSQINIQPQIISVPQGTSLNKKIPSSSNFKISVPVPLLSPPKTTTEQKLKSLSSSQLDSQKSELIDLLKQKFKKLNRVNYLTLQRIFLHLHKIASNSQKNNMDSNNLSICWWPTLLRPKFEDLNETEILTKTLQPLIRFIIDNAQSIFIS